MTFCRLSRVFMPNNVPSASANRWLSESCTSNTESVVGRVDTLGKAFSQGVITKLDEWRNYDGETVKGKPAKRTQFTSIAQLRTHGRRPGNGSTTRRGTH